MYIIGSLVITLLFAYFGAVHFSPYAHAVSFLFGMVAGFFGVLLEVTIGWYK